MLVDNKLYFSVICMHLVVSYILIYIALQKKWAKTFKVQSSYINLNLVLCEVDVIYHFMVKKKPQSLEYISDENSLFPQDLIRSLSIQITSLLKLEGRVIVLWQGNDGCYLSVCQR